jgi:hypothetical protein
MQRDTFQRDRSLPFAECRYSESSQACFKPHMHRTFSIGAVEKGEVLYTVGKREATLTPGSLALINPEILHSCNALGEEGRSYYMLYLDVPWCLSVQKSLWEVEAFVACAPIRLDDQPLYRSYCRTMQLVLRQDLHL